MDLTAGLEPAACSPYRLYSGVHYPSIALTWPSHLRQCRVSSANMLGTPAWSRTYSFGTQACPVILRIHLTLHMFNMLSLNFCGNRESIEKTTQHTCTHVPWCWCCRCQTLIAGRVMAVAALPIHLWVPHPRCWIWFHDIQQPAAARRPPVGSHGRRYLGCCSHLGSCMMLVFFRLKMKPRSLHA